MSLQLTSKQIGKRIMEMRKLKGYSQEDLAKFLKISRSSVAQMELGNRNISVMELIKLSETLGFSYNALLSKDYKTITEVTVVKEPLPEYQQMRISVPELKTDKFKNILLTYLNNAAESPMLVKRY